MNYFGIKFLYISQEAKKLKQKWTQVLCKKKIDEFVLNIKDIMSIMKKQYLENYVARFTKFSILL